MAVWKSLAAKALLPSALRASAMVKLGEEYQQGGKAGDWKVEQGAFAQSTWEDEMKVVKNCFQDQVVQKGCRRGK